jgi:hypothetical protein
MSARSNEAALRAIMPPSDIDQPLMNYYIEQRRVPIAAMDRWQSAIQAVEWAGKWEKLEIERDGICNRANGKPVGIVHFSGRSRELSQGSPLDALRQTILASGRARMRLVGIEPARPAANTAVT